MALWFAYPWALLGALAVPVLIGVYLLRARPQARVVPSLLVWRMVVRTHVSGRRPVLQRVPWIALLESVIIVLLVLAAAGVRAPRVRADAALALVLDDSASMRAPRRWRRVSVWCKGRGARAVWRCLPGAGRACCRTRRLAALY